MYRLKILLLDLLPIRMHLIKVVSVVALIEHFGLISYFRHFTEDEVSLFSLDVAKNIDRVLKLIKRDVGASSNDVNQGALQVLGVCLHDQDIVR